MGLAFQSVSQGVGGFMSRLGLVVWFLHFSFCACFLLHSLIGLLSSCFLLYVISSKIPPHASLVDKYAGPAFSRDHSHLGTMGEQCCSLNGLPRLVNKNE